MNLSDWIKVSVIAASCVCCVTKVATFIQSDRLHVKFMLTQYVTVTGHYLSLC